MILIKGKSKYAKVERIVEDFNDEVVTWMKALEENLGFKFSFIHLGTKKNIDAYGDYLIDQVSMMFGEHPYIH